MKTKTFELKRFGIEGRIAAFEFRDIRQAETDEYIVHLAANIIRQCQHSDVAKLVVSVPATWWQHFKYDFFPVWLKRKFPVKFVSVEKMYKVDLELVALPDYEYIKNISAHQPFIRSIVREQFPTQFYSPEGGKFTNSDLFPHYSTPEESFRGPK